MCLVPEPESNQRHVDLIRGSNCNGSRFTEIEISTLYQNGVGYGAWTHIDGWSEAVIDYIMAYEGGAEWAEKN